MTLETTQDSFYNGAISLTQPKTGYRFGHDTMLLAGCVSLQNGQRILELGCGVGAVLHALAFRVRCDNVSVGLVGIELQPEIAQLAEHNATANGFDIQIVNGDVTDKRLLEELGTFDHVICNPPYHPIEQSTVTQDDYRTTAHMEVVDGLADWIKAANRFLKPKGRFTMIHRADRLPDYLPLCAKFLGGITLVPFWPKIGVPARRLVLTGIKGSRGGMVMHPGLVLHTADDMPTIEAKAIIGHGQTFLV